MITWGCFVNSKLCLIISTWIIIDVLDECSIVVELYTYTSNYDAILVAHWSTEHTKLVSYLIGQFSVYIINTWQSRGAIHRMLTSLVLEQGQTHRVDLLRASAESAMQKQPSFHYQSLHSLYNLYLYLPVYINIKHSFYIKYLVK